MFRLRYKFAGVFLFAVLMRAQSPDSIRFINRSPLQESLLRGWAAKQESWDSVRIRIQKKLADTGWFHPAISMKQSESGVQKTITIEAGNRSRFGGVSLYTPEPSDSTRAGNFFHSLQGEYFSVSILENTIHALTDWYQQNGHPFAAVTIQQISIQQEDSTVRVHLGIDKGKYCTIDGYRISGNALTKDYVLTRQLRIASGSPYNQRVIDEIPVKLMKLRFLTSVSPPAYAIDRDKRGIVMLEVKEKSAGTIDGIIGYVPQTSSQKGYFTGLVNLSAQNLFGTGRAAAMRWQKIDRVSSELELRYLEPWIGGFPFSAETHYFQREQDSTYIQRTFDLALDYYASSDLSIGLLFGYQRIIPGAEKAMQTVYNSSSLSTGLKATVDSRDEPVFPRSGFFFSSTFSVITKRIAEQPSTQLPNRPAKSGQQKYSFDFQYYHSFFSGQVGVLGIHGREFHGTNVEISDYFRMGGYSTLRGYRENQFAAPRVAFANIEYRMFLERRSYLFGFYDTGYFRVPADAATNRTLSEALKTGYGFGIALETGLGVLNVSFAIARGESLAEGKIHFGILNEF